MNNNIINNHVGKGYVIGSIHEMPVDLVLLHLKKIGGVLEDG